MEYFKEKERYITESACDKPLDLRGDYSEETMDKVNKLTKNFMQNVIADYQVTVSDDQIYSHFDDLLADPTPTKLLIYFHDLPIQEDVIARLAEIKTLRHLELSFIDSNITKIPDAIFTLTNLESLHISNVKTRELQSAIGNLKKLQKLTVIQTEIETLPESILELTGLKVLEVENQLPKRVTGAYRQVM